MTNIPSNLYTGNSGIFNAVPYVNFAINQMAQRKAKDEAMDRYFGEQLSKATPTGMRSQEVPALIAAKDNLMRKYMQNKDAIHHVSKDNGAAYGEIQQGLNNIGDIIQTSKSLNENDKVGNKIFNNPATRERVTNSIPDWQKQAQPAFNVKDGQVIKNDYDEFNNPTGHKPFDISTLEFDPKKYNNDEMNKVEKGIWSTIKPSGYNSIKTPIDKFNDMQSFVGQFGKEEQKTAATKAEDAYNTDPSVKATFDAAHPFANGEMTHTPEFMHLNDIYKEATGNDIKDGSNLYAASILSKKDMQVFGEPKPVPNTEAKINDAQQFQIKKMGINDAMIRGRMKTAQGYKQALVDYREAKSTEAQDGILNKFIDNSYNAGSNRLDGTSVEHLNIDGQKYDGKVVEVPNSVKEEYTKISGQDDKGKDIKIRPDAFYLTNDKKTIIPIFLTGKRTVSGGHEISSQSKPIPIQNFKVSLSKSLLTKKATGGEVTDEDINNEFDAPETVPTSSQAVKPVKRKVKNHYGL